MVQITSAQAAERLGLSPISVRRLIRTGRLPATRLGPMYVIEEDDLELVRVRRPVGRPPGPTPPKRIRRRR